MNLYFRKCHYCRCNVDLSKPEYVSIPYTGALKLLEKITSIIALPGISICMNYRFACIPCNRDVKISKII